MENLYTLGSSLTVLDIFFQENANGRAMTPFERQVALVADVFTELRSGQVLEVGAGDVLPMFAEVTVNGKRWLAHGACRCFLSQYLPIGHTEGERAGGTTPAPSEESSMQFNLGSDVYDREGRHIGSVSRVVMDQHGTVQDIVIEQNRLLPRDVLITLQQVARVDARGVHLSLDRSGLDALPDFVETGYALPGDTTPEVIEPLAGVMFPFGLEPGVAPMIIGERMRLPEGTTDIARGYLVRCSDGSEAGTIQDIAIDESGAIDHLTISGDQEDEYPVRIRPSLIGSVEDEIVTLTLSWEELRAPLGGPATQ